jgi:hypothetical protein
MIPLGSRRSHDFHIAVRTLLPTSSGVRAPRVFDACRRSAEWSHSPTKAMPPKGGGAKPRAYTKAAGLPKEASYAPPLLYDRSYRGLRCSRGYGLSNVVYIQTGRGPRQASLPRLLVVAYGESVTNPHASVSNNCRTITDPNQRTDTRACTEPFTHTQPVTVAISC